MPNIDTVLNKLKKHYNVKEPFKVKDIEDAIEDGLVDDSEMIRQDGDIVGVTTEGYWQLINIW